jgi:hypothetical protein
MAKQLSKDEISKGIDKLDNRFSRIFILAKILNEGVKYTHNPNISPPFKVNFG